MRHKRILDIAAENPDATVEEIASEVPSATADLVEHVLEEYGDPAALSDEDATSIPADESASESHTESTAGEAEDTMDGDRPDGGSGSSDVPEREVGDDNTDASEPPDEIERGDPEESDDRPEYPAVDDLSERQVETLRAIAERPEATQRDLADRLGVTAATVSRRMNTIDGFEWADREAFANVVLPDDEPDSRESTGDGEDTPAGSGAEPVGAGESTSSSEDVADATESIADGGESSATESVADTEVKIDDEPDAPAAPSQDEDRPGDSVEASVERLERRVADIETELADSRTGEAEQSVFEDPELAHKVVRACVDSDDISPAEEIRILRSLLT